MARLLPLLICIATTLPACTRDEPPVAQAAERDKALPAREPVIPAQRRDPEQLKSDGASVGASLAAPYRPSAAPRGVTDLGHEAEKEEEEIRKRQKRPEIQK